MYEAELNLALQAAREAGDYLRRREDIHIDGQAGKDIKLSSDKRSEKMIIDRLAQTGIPVLAEESGRHAGRDTKGLLWIIDPLDGTANYLKGLMELACVSVALWKDNEPVLGVIYRFAAGEMYYGVVGEGAYCNGEPIHTSDVTQIRKAILATGFPVKRDYGKESLERFVTKVQQFKKVRMLGAAAIMGVLVAAGRFDVYVEEGIMLWDIAASTAIVSAAGGEVKVEPMGDDRCLCCLFATRALMEEYHAESL